jgi:hypothetical protein
MRSPPLAPPSPATKAGKAGTREVLRLCRAWPRHGAPEGVFESRWPPNEVDYAHKAHSAPLAGPGVRLLRPVARPFFLKKGVKKKRGFGGKIQRACLW